MIAPPTHATARPFLRHLFDVAVARADPMQAVPAHLPARPKGRLIVVGAGKASARMAEAAQAHYGPCQGLVLTRYGYGRPLSGIRVIEAAHPVPDTAGLDATGQLLDLVSDLTADDLVVALISGGGSALLCAPETGLTLADKQNLNRALLASGAPISVLNAIRKRASRIKGGKLAAACAPARVFSLLISDVPGDDPGEIASGPTVADGVAVDVADLLDRYAIAVPDHVRAALMSAPGPLMPNDPALTRASHVIVAAPGQSLAAAALIATQAGCRVELLGDALEGEARDLAQQQIDVARKIADSMDIGDPPVVLLSGGEVTVTRKGNGCGGPNAEYALAAAIALGGHPQIHLLAGDTDGVDGAAEIAGAYVGPDTIADPQAAADALADNDAHGFFATAGGQIITGPTLTNVNDFRAILVFPPG